MEDCDLTICQGKLGVRNRALTNHKEQIYWLRIIYGVEEPRLLNKLRRFDNLSCIGITCKVIEDTESHDTNSFKGLLALIIVHPFYILPCWVVK